MKKNETYTKLVNELKELQAKYLKGDLKNTSLLRSKRKEIAKELTKLNNK